MRDGSHAPDDLSPDDRGERLVALAGLEAWLERPMQVLGFIWLALLVLELTRGLSAALSLLSTAIWVVFIADFALRLVIAPAKWLYLRQNWLVALSLFVPAVRVLRFARVARVMRLAPATRGLRLVRVVGSVNRGMRSLGRTMGRRGLGYVVSLTALVAVVGAAGMYAFESELPDGRGLTDYPTALWWTAMVMTTMGSEYWPRTGAGRILCVLLAIYSAAVFGYLTASLASFFIERDAARDDAELAGRSAITALQMDIQALRVELRSLAAQSSPGDVAEG
jgi:voltage-gated potassium channel